MATKTWNVGDVLAAADMNEWAGGSTGLQFASKPADTSRTSTTTLSADPDLSVTVGANKFYLVQCVTMYYQGGLNTGNIKFDFTQPSGSVLYGSILGLGTGSFGSAGYDASGATSQQGQGAVQMATAVADLSATWTMVLNVAGTGGSLTLRWAQNTSNATSTVLRAGSWLLARRVA